MTKRLLLGSLSALAIAVSGNAFAGGEYSNNFDSGALSDDFTLVNWVNSSRSAIPDGEGERIVSGAGLNGTSGVTTNKQLDACQFAILKDSVASYKFHADWTYSISTCVKLSSNTEEFCCGIGFTSTVTATNIYCDGSVALEIGHNRDGANILKISQGLNGTYNNCSDVATNLDGVDISEWLHLTMTLGYNDSTHTYTIGYAYNHYDQATSTIGTSITSGTTTYDTSSEGINYLSDSSAVQPFLFFDGGSTGVFDNYSSSYTGSSPVPEPGTYAFLGGMGAFATALFLRRRKSARK